MTDAELRERLHAQCDYLLDQAADRLEALANKLQRMEEENTRLKIEIAAIMRGELYAPDIDGGQPINAFPTVAIGKKRKFKSRAALKD